MIDNIREFKKYLLFEFLQLDYRVRQRFQSILGDIDPTIGKNDEKVK